MAIYPIPEFLQDSHDGDEWAVASILEGRVVALLYLTDVAPELCGHVDAPSAEFILRQWARSEAHRFLELQALGDVKAGVISTHGFEETWSMAEWQANAEEIQKKR